MLSENPSFGVSDENINKFLEANYPIKPNAVDETIKVAKTHETKLLTAQAWLMNQIGYIVESHGIENLPVMLAAVAKLEKDVPQDEKRLNAKRYIGFLMKGEFVSASKEAIETGRFQDSVDHAQRGLMLHSFWEQL